MDEPTQPLNEQIELPSMTGHSTAPEWPNSVMKSSAVSSSNTDAPALPSLVNAPEITDAEIIPAETLRIPESSELPSIPTTVPTSSPKIIPMPMPKPVNTKEFALLGVAVVVRDHGRFVCENSFCGWLLFNCLPWRCIRPRFRGRDGIGGPGR